MKSVRQSRSSAELSIFVITWTIPHLPLVRLFRGLSTDHHSRKSHIMSLVDSKQHQNSDSDRFVADDAPTDREAAARAARIKAAQDHAGKYVGLLVRRKRSANRRSVAALSPSNRSRKPTCSPATLRTLAPRLLASTVSMCAARHLV